MDYTQTPSPIGPLFIAAEGDALRLIEFEHPRYPVERDEEWQAHETPLLRETVAQLSAYFAGRLVRFSIPVAPQGSTFQQRVWKALLDIPHGATCRYLDIAKALGDVRATRAVGSANGRNPIPIIIPCHRVIGADGSLIGYGGGLHIKRFLLSLEGSLREDAHRRSQRRGNDNQLALPASRMS